MIDGPVGASMHQLRDGLQSACRGRRLGPREFGDCGHHRRVVGVCQLSCQLSWVRQGIEHVFDFKESF